MLKKNLDFLSITDEAVYPVTNILESWHMFHSNGRIHSSVLSTKTFFFNIWAPRYKQTKMGYQIQNLVSQNLMSHIVLLISRLPYDVQEWVLTQYMPKDVNFKMG